MHAPTHFLKVVLDVPEALADPATVLAEQAGARGVELRDAETWVEGMPALPPGRAQVIAWLAPDTDAEGLAARVSAALGEPDLRVAFERVAAEDWVQKVRDQFQPVRLGRRLRIRASWHAPLAPREPDLVELEIDPGLAFGTGGHATTSLCLEALEETVDARRARGERPAVLDVGTGSGILAITAARLGAGPCHGIDNDPMAVQVARENAALNGVADATAFSNVPPAVHSGRYELVLANIQLGVLQDLAEGIAARVAPGGDLFLSGLLVEQGDEAEAAYVPHGLEPAGRRVQDGWALVHLRRPA